ncbi:MAG: MFS transporter [bacterium]
MGIWRRHIHLTHSFDGMQAFYLNALMRSLMFAIIGIFTPIFVYDIMRPILGTVGYGIAAVAAYFLLMRVMTIVTLIPSSKLIEKLGFRKSVMLSGVFLSLYLGALLMANQDWRWLIVALLAQGINTPLYWISRLSTLSQDSTKGKIGKQMGLLSVLEKLAGVLGPVAGGLMIEKWGFETLYGVALLVMIVSIWPLLTMPHHTHKNGVSIRGYFLWLKNRRFSHQAIGTVGKGMNDYAAGVVWPLAVVMLGVNLGLMGGVFSMVALVGVVMKWGSGVMFDKLHKKGGKEDETMFAIASIGQAISWIFRLFVKTVGGVLAVDLSAVLFGMTYENIADDYMVMGGKRMHEIAYYTYRELTYSVVVVVFMGMLMVGAILNIWKELLFISTSWWMIVGIVQARESNMR